MKTVELFCGTKSFSKYAKKLGHETYTVDSEPRFKPDMILDLLLEMPEQLLDKITQADVVWMSPPCTTFSVSSGNIHWDRNRQPKTISAAQGLRMLNKCMTITRIMKPGAIYFIENPRGRARWFMPESTRQTPWYCQYGDFRAKPTDIWTNLTSWKAKECSNGNKSCHHQRAPRGAKAGTQNMSSSRTRSQIPEGLFKELFEEISKHRNEQRPQPQEEIPGPGRIAEQAILGDDRLPREIPQIQERGHNIPSILELPNQRQD